MPALLWIVSTLLVLAGLVGIVLPALPGTVLIFAGLWLAAWADGFAHVGAVPLVLLALMTVATYFVDAAMMALGMQRLGASRRAMAGAAIGMLVGAFLGIPGLIVGPFAGAVLGEMTVHRDIARAGRAGVAAWIGFVIGMAVKVGFGFVMIGTFIAAWLL